MLNHWPRSQESQELLAISCHWNIGPHLRPFERSFVTICLVFHAPKFGTVSSLAFHWKALSTRFSPVKAVCHSIWVVLSPIGLRSSWSLVLFWQDHSSVFTWGLFLGESPRPNRGLCRVDQVSRSYWEYRGDQPETRIPNSGYDQLSWNNKKGCTKTHDDRSSLTGRLLHNDGLLASLARVKEETCELACIWPLE